MAASSKVFVGTGKGVHCLTLKDGQLAPLALQKQFVNHIAVRDQHLIAACPVFGPIHTKHYGVKEEDQQEDGGLWYSDLSKNPEKSEQVWTGDARTCNIGPVSAGRNPRFFVGGEPADVLYSDDFGESWTGDSFKRLPSRDKWTFPGPPHKAHTLSIDFAETGGESYVIAGVEVGGVALSKDNGDSWQELGWGQICPDVHRCRADPFTPNRWWAVTGGGGPLEHLSKIPGGLWATEDCGKNWVRVETIPKQWYLTGLAFNPYKQGEVIVAAADDPPFHGVYLYYTKDGGGNWEEITDQVFSGQLAKEKGNETPVPFFVKEGVLIGTETGRILFADRATGAEWKVIGTLPSRVTCFAADGQSPSSTMH